MGRIADLRLAEDELRQAIRELTAARLRVTLAQLALNQLRRTPQGAQ